MLQILLLRVNSESLLTPFSFYGKRLLYLIWYGSPIHINSGKVFSLYSKYYKHLVKKCILYEKEVSFSLFSTRCLACHISKCSGSDVASTFARPFFIAFSFCSVSPLYEHWSFKDSIKNAAAQLSKKHSSAKQRAKTYPFASFASTATWKWISDEIQEKNIWSTDVKPLQSNAFSAKFLWYNFPCHSSTQICINFECMHILFSWSHRLSQCSVSCFYRKMSKGTLTFYQTNNLETQCFPDRIGGWSFCHICRGHLQCQRS